MQFFILKKISALATSSECFPVLLTGITIILFVQYNRRDLYLSYNNKMKKKLVKI